MKRICIKKLTIVTACILIVCFSIIGIGITKSTTYAMKTNMKAMLEEIDEIIADKTDLSYSSNPYDYIKNNKYYNNILNLGIDALPIVVDELKESDESGLKEFILALAIEDISGIQISTTEGEWKDSDEFLDKYEIFMRNVEDNVNIIITSKGASKSEKLERLKQYGIYAVPYLKEVTSYQDKDHIAVKTVKEICNNFKKETKSEDIDKNDIEIVEKLVGEFVE